MSLFRIFGIVLALALLAGCSAGTPAPPAPPATCPPPPTADLATSDGWVAHLAAEPASTGLVVDDGRGHVVAHEATTPFPLASAAKVVHLAAYGAAVAGGRIRPDEPVALADWERWFLPGTDAGAHARALGRLGLRAGGTATVDQLVTAIVQESDNAAGDWLRARLGDDALRAAASSAGWGDVDLPSFSGAVARLALPEQVPPGTHGRPELAALDTALGQRVGDDPAFRAEVVRRSAAAATSPGFADTAARWASTTAAGTPTQLIGTYRAIATGAVPGADVAQRFLTWQGAQPSLGGTLGFKSGSYPGVLTFGSFLRRDDGSLGYAVVLARDLPAVPSLDQQTRGEQLLALSALRSSRTFDRLRCVA
jgi:Beta-lactamase enzyme family